MKTAITATFKHRNSEKYLENFNNIIKNISNDDSLINRWDKYINEHEYAKEIAFIDTVKAIEKIYNVLFE